MYATCYEWLYTSMKKLMPLQLSSFIHEDISHTKKPFRCFSILDNLGFSLFVQDCKLGKQAQLQKRCYIFIPWKLSLHHAACCKFVFNEASSSDPVSSVIDDKCEDGIVVSSVEPAEFRGNVVSDEKDAFISSYFARTFCSASLISNASNIIASSFPTRSIILCKRNWERWHCSIRVAVSSSYIYQKFLRSQSNGESFRKQAILSLLWLT